MTPQTARNLPGIKQHIFRATAILAAGLNPGSRRNHIVAASILFLALLTPLAAGYRDTIGYNLLKAELGDALPRGSSIPVAQVEWDSDLSVYAPDPGGELSGKTFHYPGRQPNGWFNHATQVAHRFYGRNTSIAPDVQTIYAFGVSGYMDTLNIWQGTPPNQGNAPHWKVENHSWVGSYHSTNREILRKSDYNVIEHNIFVSAGLDNGTGSMRPLMANFHNGMAVGVASGSHSRGGSNEETDGRVRPDIVVPIWSTSYATGVISSAATLLLDHVNGDSALEHAGNIPVIKAILMAGASKNSFSNWSNTPSRPLDPVYGAGALNIYNSYHILDSGRHSGALQSDRVSGWDWDSVDQSSINTYRFRVPEGESVRFSSILSWNRNIVASPDYYRWFYTHDQLSLSLWEADSQGNPIELIDLSESDIDNVGHIYRTLSAGDYLLEVEFRLQGDVFIQSESSQLTVEEMVANDWGDENDLRTEVPYGLAWRLDLPPGGGTGDEDGDSGDSGEGDDDDETGDSDDSDDDPAHPDSAQYRYIRWEITERKGGANSIQVARLTLTQDQTPVVWPSESTASNPGGSNPSNERPARAIDGSSSTKWLDFNFSSSSSSSSGSSILEIDTGSGNAVTFDGYRWTTANDAVDRDPVSWNLYGSDDGNEWTLLDSREKQSITDSRRTNTQVFAIDPVSDDEEDPDLPPLNPKIINPKSDEVFTLPKSLNILTEIEGDAERAAKLEYFANGHAIGETTSVDDPLAWTIEEAGEYTLQVRVTETNGETSECETVTVTILPAPLEITLLGPNDGAAFSFGDPIDLQAELTSGDSQRLDHVTFLADGEPVAQTGDLAEAIDWTPETYGDIILAARATDIDGNTSLSGSVTVTVQPPALSVALVAPEEGATFAHGDAISLAAEQVSGEAYRLDHVTFLADGQPVAQTGDLAEAIDWTPETYGDITLRARATDIDGNTSLSGSVAITVQPPALSVALVAPEDGAIFAHGDAISLAAEQVSGEAYRLDHVTFLADGEPVAQTGDLTETIEWMPETYGEFTLTARVTDIDGKQTVSEAATVQVLPAPLTVTITSPQEGDSLELGSSFTLTASLSGDPDQLKEIIFYANGSELASLSDASESTTWEPGQTGDFSVNATVTDIHGQITSTAPTFVSVTEPTNEEQQQESEKSDEKEEDQTEINKESVRFQYIRWEITERKGSANSIQASRFDLLLDDEVISWSEGELASNPGGSNPSNEGPHQAIDNSSNAKWLDFNFAEENPSLTGKSVLEIDLGADPAAFNSYRWTTANDHPSRDPVSWNVYGSHDGIEWTLMDTRTQEPISDQRFNATKQYKLSTYTGDFEPTVPEGVLVSQDIGSVSVAGSAKVDASGRFTLTTTGSDIWGREDAFHFVYYRLSGDGAIIARVNGIESTDPYAKAGIMIRDTLGPDSRNTFLTSTLERSVSLQRRFAAGEFTYDSTRWGRPMPVWLKLEREGDQIRSFYSRNGSNWRPLTSITVSFAEETYVGLAVAGDHSTTARFDSVEIPGYSNDTYTVEHHDPIVSAQPAGGSIEATNDIPSVELATTGGSVDPVEADRLTLFLNRSKNLSGDVFVRYEISGPGAEWIDTEQAPTQVEIPADSETGRLTLHVKPNAYLPEDTELIVHLSEDSAYELEESRAASLTLSKRPIDAWKSLHFTDAEQANPLVSSDSAAPTGDGTPNLLKYALGRAPHERLSNTERPGLTTRDGQMALQFERPSGIRDIRYIVEASSDLKTWRPLGDQAVEVLPADQDGRERVIARDLNPDADKQRFLRLRVERR